MTQAEWVRIFAQMRAWWPQAQIPDGSLAVWYDDLADQHPAQVQAAAKAIYRDGADWPPNGAQILTKIAELTIDAPAWGQVKAELLRAQATPTVLRDPCELGRCDGSGYLIDDQAREATPCPCRPALLERLRARRAESLTEHPVVQRFLESVGPREVVDVLAGDRTAEAQVRAKYEAFCRGEQREITYAGIPTAGLPALERRQPRELGDVVRGYLEQAR
jgi:hypothetical protein